MSESTESKTAPVPEDWTGTAAQLAQVLVQVLPRYTLSPEPLPSERLIRFYVTSGVLLKPQREGREALFGQRQALQFLAARALLEDGWPLAKVAAYLQGLTDSDLLALLPEREAIAPAPSGGGAAAGPTFAEQLVARFRKSAQAPPAAPPMAPVPQIAQKKSAVPLGIPLPAPGEEAFKERQSFRAVRREQAAEMSAAPIPELLAADELRAVEEEAVATTERDVRVHISLTPWCEIALRQDSLESLTPEDVESATTLFRTALENELPD